MNNAMNGAQCTIFPVWEAKNVKKRVSPAGPYNDPAIYRQDRERPWMTASFRALPMHSPVLAAPGGV